MKALLLASVLIVSSSCVAQASPAAKADHVAAKPGQASTDIIPGAVDNSNTCFTMRSYIFTQRDGSLELTGEKTCTSAQHFHAAYIPARPPQVRATPAVLKQRKADPSQP